MSVEDPLRLVTVVIEVTGVVVIVIGALIALAVALGRLFKEGHEAAYRVFRQGLGRSILLGLELLVAADIIRTVVIEPSFQSVGILGFVVVIRTFLSFSLAVELEGRWPWARPHPPHLVADKGVKP